MVGFAGPNKQEDPLGKNVVFNPALIETDIAETIDQEQLAISFKKSEVGDPVKAKLVLDQENEAKKQEIRKEQQRLKVMMNFF